MSKIYNIDEREEVCANCKHYIQHYTRSRIWGISPCNAGHCIYPRFKDRKPGTPACGYFGFGELEE